MRKASRPDFWYQRLKPRQSNTRSPMNRKQRRAGRTHGTGPFGRGRSDSPADQLFELGQAHHDQGRLTEAETIFRRALQLDPKHSGCLNRLGILAHQCGHPDAAVTLIGQAIATEWRRCGISLQHRPGACRARPHGRGGDAQPAGRRARAGLRGCPHQSRRCTRRARALERSCAALSTRAGAQGGFAGRLS